MALPNLCVTGTPGVGKSSLAQELCRRVPQLTYLDVGKAIKEQQLYSEWDDAYDASIMDEDRVFDFVEKLIDSTPQGGVIVDFHSIGIFSPDMFAGALVLRADTTVLWDRLAQRGYPEAKIQENVEAEIFQTCFEEAVELIGADNVISRDNNTPQDAEENLKFLLKFFNQ